jgi:hypothetical protein
MPFPDTSKIGRFSKTLNLGVLGTLLNTVEETALPLAAFL